MHCLERFASDEQKNRWLPELASGSALGCFALTEAHGGSDPARMATRAERRGGDWLLNGEKHWITNGAIADIAIVWGMVDGRAAAFLVERGSAGFEARTIRNKMSLRAANTAVVSLADVRVPERSRLPGVEGLGSALTCLNQARFGIAWGALGAARACLEVALAHTSDRVLFGRPLSRTQLMQSRLADAARRLTTGQLLALRLGRLKDSGHVAPAQVSLAKWNNVRAALDIARDCRDILGAAGITLDHAPLRHMLNLESVSTYEGTESIHRLVVGRELTGENAF
jgi:glutaryl-CoA dehydrogenase